MTAAVSRTSPAAVKAAVEAALSPERRRLIVTAAAKEAQARAEAAYRAEHGKDPTTQIKIDGRPATALANLNPDRGEVDFDFGRIADALIWIHQQLVTHSPVLTGQYAASHIMLADDQEADPSNPPPAERYVFLNVQPYARKVEKYRAPAGVYEAVAVLGARQFGNTANIGFGYESPLLDYIPGEQGRQARARLRQQRLRVSAMRLERTTRVPAIVVTSR